MGSDEAAAFNSGRPLQCGHPRRASSGCCSVGQGGALYFSSWIASCCALGLMLYQKSCFHCASWLPLGCSMKLYCEGLADRGIVRAFSSMHQRCGAGASEEGPAVPGCAHRKRGDRAGGGPSDALALQHHKHPQSSSAHEGACCSEADSAEALSPCARACAKQHVTRLQSYAGLSASRKVVGTDISGVTVSVRLGLDSQLMHAD